jgi:type II secretory pathway pseudopilin PulG
MKIFCDHRGFTLIEAIVFFVLVAVLSTYLIIFTKTGYVESVTGVTWLSDEAAVQGMMENVVGEYKHLLSTSTGGDVLAQLKTYVETTSPYSGALLASESGYISFNASGANFASTWPPTSSPPSQNPVLIITLQSHEQKLSALFTQ